MNDYKTTAGIFRAGGIIVEEFKWYFRPQNQDDIGVDAIIEQKIGEKGTGRFIAAQIKTGKGNVYETGNYFTYYISITHYNYWINLELPVVIIFYNEDDDQKVYWEEISYKNIKLTPKGYRIDIPKNKILNKDSKIEFEKILSTNMSNFLISEFSVSKYTLDGYSEKLLYSEVKIADIINAVVKIVGYQKYLKDLVNLEGKKVIDLLTKGYNEDSILINDLIMRIDKKFNSLSDEINKQLVTFSELMPKYFLQNRLKIKYQIALLKNVKDEDLRVHHESMFGLSLEMFTTSLKLRRVIESLQSLPEPFNKNGKKNLENAIKLFIQESQISYGIIVNTNLGVMRSILNI